MEVTNKDASSLSRTELRMQKLAEYLAAKGRLKPPNPKPYLKNTAVLAKPPGAEQRSHATAKEKENSAPSGTGAKKDIPKGHALVEKNRNSRTFLKATSAALPRLPLKCTVIQAASDKNKNARTLPKAPSALPTRLPFKYTLSQTDSEQARTHFKDTTHTTKNSSVKELQTQSVVQTNIAAHKQEKTVRKGPASVSSQAQQLHRTSMNARTSVVKDPHKSQVKCPTRKEHLTNTVPSCTDTRPLHSKQATMMLKATRETNNFNKTHTESRKPLNSYPLSKPGKSGKTQTGPQNTRLSSKIGNDPRLTHTQRNVPVTLRQRSSLMSTFTKSENATKSTSVSIAGVKNAAQRQQQRRTTFKIPPKPTIQASVPQTLPRPTKLSSLTMGPVQPKTPKSTFNPGPDGVRTVPLDAKYKSTTAQEERLRKLQEWREAKGITYKRPPMPIQPARRKTTAVPPQGYWSTMEQEDEVHSFVCAVDQSLNDCINLLQQGCPVDQVQDVLARVPMAQKFAKYWICQVRLMEQEGNFEVLPTFEEAVRVVREPVDELRSVVFEILKKKDAKESFSERENEVGSDDHEEHSFKTFTPKPVGALIRGEKQDTSVIKYKITATPGGKKRQQKPGHVNGHELRFFTPVRRSLRIEKTATRYPAVLQEHDPCVTSLHELIAEAESQSESTRTPETSTSPLYVYRENEALKDHVQIELVYDDTVAS